MAKNELEIVTEMRMDQRARSIKREMKAIRATVETIADCDWSGEVRHDLRICGRRSGRLHRQSRRWASEGVGSRLKESACPGLPRPGHIRFPGMQGGG